MDMIALLRTERDKVARQLHGLNAALAAFAGTYTTGSFRPRRQMSAAARARIAAAQKARWAKVRGEQKVVPIASKTGKRTMSAAARRKIAASKKAWWAARRRAQKKG
ncbi:MAG TPA: hypothetical protein VGU64_10905 [Terriglobales bacterium]|nr:hypothetical protein [Terriglobales bacterium]